MIDKIKELENRVKELENELLSFKKYGLVWDLEAEPEKVVNECKSKMPLLAIDYTKTISTGNLNNFLIEGDNFHSLTVLNYILGSSIDVIYIDPPYNTGNNDFIYNDKFVNNDDGYRHSKWLNLLSKRLVLAKQLLKNDGILFLSIDDNEQANAKLLLDSIFGEHNFLACLPRITKKSGKDHAVGVAKKVQPSIVAITVEYSVNSIFNRIIGECVGRYHASTTQGVIICTLPIASRLHSLMRKFPSPYVLTPFTLYIGLTR